MRYPLPLYLYEVLWWIAVDGPLPAGEVAWRRNRRRRDVAEPWTAQSAAARMRSLTRRGLLHRDDGGIYRLTDRAREFMYEEAG